MNSPWWWWWWLSSLCSDCRTEHSRSDARAMPSWNPMREDPRHFLIGRDRCIQHWHRRSSMWDEERSSPSHARRVTTTKGAERNISFADTSYCTATTRFYSESSSSSFLQCWNQYPDWSKCHRQRWSNVATKSVTADHVRIVAENAWAMHTEDLSSGRSDNHSDSSWWKRSVGHVEINGDASFHLRSHNPHLTLIAFVSASCWSFAHRTHWYSLMNNRMSRATEVGKDSATSVVSIWPFFFANPTIEWEKVCSWTWLVNEDVSESWATNSSCRYYCSRASEGFFRIHWS